MSYSFSVTASTKDEACQKVADQLSQVVLTQPVHESDRQAAQNAAEAFINTLADPAEGQCINAYVSGSLGWTGEPDDHNFTSANVSVQASLGTKT